MTTNEKRRAVTYIAEQLKHYKRFKELGERDYADRYRIKVWGATGMLALVLQDNSVAYKMLCDMRTEIMQNDAIPIERINWYADNLE